MSFSWWLWPSSAIYLQEGEGKYIPVIQDRKLFLPPGFSDLNYSQECLCTVKNVVSATFLSGIFWSGNHVPCLKSPLAWKMCYIGCLFKTFGNVWLSTIWQPGFLCECNIGVVCWLHWGPNCFQSAVFYLYNLKDHLPVYNPAWELKSSKQKPFSCPISYSQQHNAQKGLFCGGPQALEIQITPSLLVFRRVVITALWNQAFVLSCILGYCEFHRFLLFDYIL